MQHRTHRPRALTALLGAGLLVGTGGCLDSPVVDQTGDTPILRMVLGPGAAILPSGAVSLSGIIISGFDLAVSDGFARGIAPADEFQPITNPFGASNAYDVGKGVRNGMQDPRLPAMTSTTAAAGEFWGLFNPFFTNNGDGIHDLFGEITGATPSTIHSIVLARMSLTINGELDQHQVLTGRRVTNPDMLSFMPGTTTSYATVECNFIAATPITASMNPVMLGFRESAADGTLPIDCIPAATGDSPWYRDSSTSSPAGALVPDSLPFGDNRVGATLAPGQYNYVLIYEGLVTDPTTAGPPAVRIQVGPDVDASGNVINNALAPFPTAPIGGVLADLPGGGSAFAAPGEIDFSISGLPATSFGIALVNRSSGATSPAMAEIDIDGAASMGSSFSVSGPGDAVSLSLKDMDFGTYTDVALTLGDAPFLFREYLTSTKALSAGPATFGAIRNGSTRAFSVAGSGIGEFFGDVLQVTLRRLPQPPGGFHYQSYLVTLSSGAVAGQTRANSITLDDAGNAIDRIEASQVGGFGGYNAYYLVLEPDGQSMLTDLQIQVSEDYRAKFKDFFGG